MGETDHVQLAIVGMPGSGKTVLISTMASKMSDYSNAGVLMLPAGEERYTTHLYVQKNWQILDSGRWPESTPMGEMVNLQWELLTRKHSATIRFSDCAGQDINSLFGKNFTQDSIPASVKSLYKKLSDANIILIIVNMEDLIGRSAQVSATNGAAIDQMIHVLLDKNQKIPRKVALVINQYDRYKQEVDNVFSGDIYAYLRHHLPLLYAQHLRQKQLEIIPVSAVAETETLVNNGIASPVPAPNFSSYNLDTLIHWIVDSIDELAEEKESIKRKCTPPPNNRAEFIVFLVLGVIPILIISVLPLYVLYSCLYGADFLNSPKYLFDAGLILINCMGLSTGYYFVIHTWYKTKRFPGFKFSIAPILSVILCGIGCALLAVGFFCSYSVPDGLFIGGGVIGSLLGVLAAIGLVNKKYWMSFISFCIISGWFIGCTFGFILTMFQCQDTGVPVAYQDTGVPVVYQDTGVPVAYIARGGIFGALLVLIYGWFIPLKDYKLPQFFYAVIESHKPWHKYRNSYLALWALFGGMALLQVIILVVCHYVYLPK